MNAEMAERKWKKEKVNAFVSAFKNLMFTYQLKFKEVSNTYLS